LLTCDNFMPFWNSIQYMPITYIMAVSYRGVHPDERDFGKQVTYKIIQMVARRMVATTVFDISTWAWGNDRSILGVAPFGSHLRRKLQGQRIISGLCGPIYDGTNQAGAAGHPVRGPEQLQPALGLKP
jgi:hypothetical protein